MSKPKAKNPTNSLARYRAEVKADPFVLWLDDDEKIEIPRPTGTMMLAAEDAYNNGTSRDVIEAFCGDKAQEFLAAVEGEDMAVMFNIISDMREHFGLGE